MSHSVGLRVEDLRKRFGKLDVLRGVDLDVEPGRITAIAGPNAAGKSTLIKCLLGLVHPDQGRVLIDGHEAGSDPALRTRFGYMPQAARFPENLSGREVLRLLAELRGNPRDTDEDLLHAFHLESELDKPVRTLSGGTRQKLSAVTAFLFRPGLLVLDEPTAGLDPLASGVLKEKIQEAASGGVTVLLTSHLMGEMEELAETIVYFVDGAVSFRGNLDELWRLTGEQRLERAVARLMRARIVA